MAKRGKRVLLIDADAQGSLTASLGYTEPDKLEVTLAKIMERIVNEDFPEPSGLCRSFVEIRRCWRR